MTQFWNPLTDAPPSTVPLPEAPLVRVIGQVRFPMIASISKSEFIGPFQEAIRQQYPILEREDVAAFSLVGLENGSSSHRFWRFHDTDRRWRVSLAENSISLETRLYSSRDEFLGRLTELLKAVQMNFRPAGLVRLGIRYIDRMENYAPEKLTKQVNATVAGVLATPLAHNVQHSLTELLLEVPEPEAQLRVRWGHLPGGKTFDPTTIEPIDVPSWILDLDMFAAGNEAPFDAGQISKLAEQFVDRLYVVFRWVVTEEFLKSYGGEL